MENIVERMRTYLLNNIEKEITLEELERVFCYNRYYLIRLFKLYTGLTIKEFTNFIKILKTINQLIFTEDTILKIALNNGFNSQEYYSERFKETIGISPLKFRKEYSNLDKITNVRELKLKKEYLTYINKFQRKLIEFSPTYDETMKLKKTA